MGSAAIWGPLCAFAASCTWALGVTIYARLARDLPPWSINATRAAVALPVFALWCAIALGGPTQVIVHIRLLGGVRLMFLALSMVASYALGDLLFLRAAQSLGTPAALAIASIYPVPSALAGLWARGENLGLVRWLGLFAVVSGSILVILSASAAPPAPGSPRMRPRALMIGVALALATAGLWSLNVYAVARGSHGVPTVLAGLVRMAMGLALAPTVGALVAPLLGRPWKPWILPWSRLKPLLWAFAFESVAGTFAYTYGLSHAPLAVGAALSSLAPVIAVPVAIIARTERPSVRKGIGIVLVVAGTVALLAG